MSPTWRPDDTFLNKESGKLKGLTRVKDALKKSGVKGGRRVVTSRDQGQAEVRNDLKRIRSPKGFQQWQLPVALGPNQNIFFFRTVGAPGAVLPEHTHKVDLLRFVISGSATYKGQELTAGDWMFVPAGVPYGLTVGPNGIDVFHGYFPKDVADDADVNKRRRRPRNRIVPPA
jgi:quercetin dioxygenase-like cupin family protein